MGSATVERNSDESLGYDFEDRQTRLQLELMDDLQKLGVSKYLDLPQLVVVGDQSTGKSSVLQAVTDIPFPIDDKMCTRFATEIVLRRTSDETTSIDISIIPSADEGPDRKKLLQDWQPEGFDQTATLNKATMLSVFSQAERIIFGDSIKQNSMGSGRRLNRLSSSILRITRRGPKETNFAIVDVPGLVRGNETNTEHRTAKTLVKKYLENLRSIVVVVIDVVDLERQEIFQMLNGLPDEESRVIGVINKCDTKQKKSHDWVFDLIRNIDQSKSRRYLKEGWYGLRNRQASEIGVSDQERDRLEQEFFSGDEWSSLDQGKLGRHELKKALIKMRNRHVKRSIPELLSEIQNKLDVCSGRLFELGEPRTTNQAQFVLINRIAMDYSRKARSGLEGHYNDLSDSQTFVRRRVLDDLDRFQVEMASSGLREPFRTSEEDAAIIANVDETSWAATFMKIPTYNWIHTAIKNYRVNSDCRKANPEVESKLWKEQTVSWNKIAANSLRKIEDTVETINAALFQEACPDKDLRLKLMSWLQDDFMKASAEAQKELQRLLQDEREAQLFSLQPLKYRLEQSYRELRVHTISEKYKKRRPQSAKANVAAEDLDLNPVSSSLIINSLIYNNPELVGVLDIHDSLAAYYDIALYRFIDNFALQVVERHLLGPNGPLRLFNSDYVTQKLYGDAHAEVLNGLAGEDPAVAQERIEIETEKASLEESRKRVQNFRVL